MIILGRIWGAPQIVVTAATVRSPAQPDSAPLSHVNAMGDTAVRFPDHAAPLSI